MGEFEPEGKICSRCGAEKVLTEFYKRSSSRDGLEACCKTCSLVASKNWRLSNPEYKKRWDKERGKIWSFEYRQANPEKIAAQKRKSNYGISDVEYQSLLDSQGGVCAICNLPDLNKRLGVDHDHETDEIRGLLCGTCNLALGLFGDDRDRLRSAIEYLERSVNYV
jgi:hypothetical protein